MWVGSYNGIEKILSTCYSFSVWVAIVEYKTYYQNVRNNMNRARKFILKNKIIKLKKYNSPIDKL